MGLSAASLFSSLLASETKSLAAVPLLACLAARTAAFNGMAALSSGAGWQSAEAPFFLIWHPP